MRRALRWFLATFLLLTCHGAHVFAADQSIEPPLLQAPILQAPILEDQVRSGRLPPVGERLPNEPAVVDAAGVIGRYGGQLRVMSSNPTQLNELTYFLTEPMLRFAADGRTIRPNVARRWLMSDDGRTITIWLRKGMRWSDGAPLTVQDVLFAFEDVLKNEALTPVFPSAYACGGEPMQIEAIDDHAFRIRFAEPYGSFPYFLIHSVASRSLVMPRHWLKQFHPKYTPEAEILKRAREHGFEQWHELFLDQNFLVRATGVGPNTPPQYPVLSAWHVHSAPAEGNVLLSRNPYYWKVDRAGNQLPYIDTIHSTFIAKHEAQNLKLISGQIDFAGMEGTFDNAPLFLSHRRKGRYRVFFWECNWGARVAFYLNQTHRDPVLRALFQDREFHIALSLGINRAQINDVLYFGKCQPQQLTANPACSYYESRFARAHAQYDADEANRILDRIGLAARRGRWRVRPDGKVLTINCQVLDGGFRPQTAELVKEYWEDLGVLVSMRVVDPNLWRTRAGANAMDVCIYPDDVATDVMILNAPVYGIQTWAPLWARYFNSGGAKGEQPPPHVVELYEAWSQMRRTTNDARRIELGKKLIRSQAQNLWGIGTVGRLVRPIIVSNRMRNVPAEGLWGYPWLATCLHHPERFFLVGEGEASDEAIPMESGQAPRRRDGATKGGP